MKKKRKVGINFLKEQSGYSYKLIGQTTKNKTLVLKCKKFFHMYNISTEFSRVVKFTVINTMLVFDVDFK